MLQEEGLDNVFARHARHAEATRRAVRGWGLEILCLDPGEYSNSLTALLTPEGHDADHVRKVILERFDMSLGAGLGKLKGKVFRIGNLGHFNDLMLAGTLCGWRWAWRRRGFRCARGGVQAALDYLATPGQEACDGPRCGVICHPTRAMTGPVAHRDRRARRGRRRSLRRRG
jgi:alanine-glyoxylate transaminase/serine-glyoxylate transaminase/serine-pyruvate transaminase